MSKNILFVNIADLHASADPRKQEKFKASIDEILQHLRKGRYEFVLISGDVWDRPQYFKEQSAVRMVFDAISSIARYVNHVFIVKGNNYHDAPGSIDLLNSIAPNVHAYEHPACLLINKTLGVVDLLRTEFDYTNSLYDYIVSLVPFPEKQNFVFPGSIDDNNREFQDKLEGLFDLFSLVTANYDCPKVMGLHANIQGSRLSSGQTFYGQDVVITPNIIERAKHHYYGAGHIHSFTELAENMYMVGNLYNCNWGELEQKGFLEAEIENADGWKTYRSWFPYQNSRPMALVTGGFTNGDWFFDLDTKEQDHAMHVAREANSEVKFRYTVLENERSLVTEFHLAGIKQLFGDDVVIEENPIPVEREKRSTEIMQVLSLTDEVRVYAENTEQGEIVTESLNNKIAEIEVNVL